MHLTRLCSFLSCSIFTLPPSLSFLPLPPPYFFSFSHTSFFPLLFLLAQDLPPLHVQGYILSFLPSPHLLLLTYSRENKVRWVVRLSSGGCTHHVQTCLQWAEPNKARRRGWKMIGLSVVVEQFLETSRTRVIYTFKLVFCCHPFCYRDVSKFAVKINYSVQITCIVVCLLFAQYYTTGGLFRP